VASKNAGRSAREGVGGLSLPSRAWLAAGRTDPGDAVRVRRAHLPPAAVQLQPDGSASSFDGRSTEPVGSPSVGVCAV